MACAKLSPPSEIRLQKFLASAGLGSRRACERLIGLGVVAVDGRVVTDQGVKINPSRQSVMVEGCPVTVDAHVYWLLYKPTGYICTCDDPDQRATFRDLLPSDAPRLFPVGRLDRDSEGLLLLTNDGEWAQHIQHPRYVVEKEYLVWTDRALPITATRQLRQGVEDRGETLRVKSLRREPRKMATGACYRVVLTEGRNRHIRRLFSAVAVQVTRLRRVRVGSIKLGGLRPGQYRVLTATEVAALRVSR